jgi:phytoene/squalene synthetase
MSSIQWTACEALDRRVDSDRYLAALFAPPQRRPYLFALYAFNYEIAKTSDSVSQPVMGQIRLQWWREAVEGIYSGQVHQHEMVLALAETVCACDLPRGLLDGLIDAREHDLDETPFADWASLEAYADATSGHIMRLAARILGVNLELDEAASEAGIAYALTGFLRSFPYHASRRRLILPEKALRAVSLSKEQIFSGTMDEKMTALFALTAERARDHLRKAHAMRFTRALLPALLPAALVPFYLKILTRPGFNPFRDFTEIAVHRRQLAMLGAMLRRRI